MKNLLDPDSSPTALEKNQSFWQPLSLFLILLCGVLSLTSKTSIESLEIIDQKDQSVLDKAPNKPMNLKQPVATSIHQREKADSSGSIMSGIPRSEKDHLMTRLESKVSLFGQSRIIDSAQGIRIGFKIPFYYSSSQIKVDPELWPLLRYLGSELYQTRARVVIESTAPSTKKRNSPQEKFQLASDRGQWLVQFWLKESGLDPNQIIISSQVSQPQNNSLNQENKGSSHGWVEILVKL